MNDALFLSLVVAAIVVTGFLYFRLGKSFAGAFAALALLALAYLKGRTGAQQEAKTDVLKEEVKNAEKREDAVAQANAAADHVRVVVSNDPGKLREHDAFERR